MKRRSTKKASRASKRNEAPWPAPKPLEGPPLPAFPTKALPSWLGAWVEAQTTALQVPADLPALLALSVLATACAQRFQISVRRGWIEPLNLYLLVALPSGTRKSVVFEAATRPLVAFELEQARQLKEAVPIAEEMMRQARLRLVVAADSVVQSAGEKNDPAGAEPWRIFVSDATPERVASLLAENAGRGALR
jgi:replicative DNA helicase